MTYTLDDYDPDADFDAWYTDETGREIISRLTRKASAVQILEIGCATGRMTTQLVGAGRMVLGCSLNAAMIERARARRLDGARFICADVLTMRDMEFDAIVCCLVLHEVPDVRAIMAKAHDLLAPSGRVFVTVPSANSIHLTGEASARGDRFGVRRLWTPGRWHTELIDGTGLRVVERFEMMAKPYPNAKMECLNPDVLAHFASYRGPGGTLCYFELERAN